MNKPLFSLLLMLVIGISNSFSQNEASKWFFGKKAGLDFSTNPPTTLNIGQMVAFEGCSSVADAAGNLLFYTDGDTIWNKQHQVMANGFGLAGNNASSQSALIVKQPGSNNFYFVFTVDAGGNANGLSYSIVDLSLAAGMGSVTVKNGALYTPVAEKLTAVRHCNGSDIWVLAHELSSVNFRAYLVTSAGLNTLPVISGVGPLLPVADADGCMKLSPNGRKLAMVAPGSSSGLFDFDASTGNVSNYMALSNVSAAYGCEFSPNSTRLYITHQSGQALCQMDLCAGSNAAILSSSVALSVPPITFLGALQLAPNGKIYAAQLFQASLGVINSPNLAGMASNFAPSALALGTGSCNYGLPGFPAHHLKELPGPLNYAVNCATVSFSQPTLSPLSGCSAASYPYTSFMWMFGDPASGQADTSMTPNPSHGYPGSGTYPVKLIYYSSCGTDTIRGSVTLSGLPPLTISGKTTLCVGESSLLEARGATTYTWNTGVTGAYLTATPGVTTVYTVTGTSNGCSVPKTVTVNVNSCFAINEAEATLNTISLYPNPGSSFVVSSSEKPGHLTVYGLAGNLVLERDLEAGSSSIDIRTWPAGLYLLHYTLNGSSTVKKFVKLAAE